MNSPEDIMSLDDYIKEFDGGKEYLETLEEKHLELVKANDWKETPESREVAAEYFSSNYSKECMECGGWAKITCQYH